MPSTYTSLGTELMVTGEKSGQWGTITNTNLQILEQIASGYVAQALTDGSTLALTKNSGTTGATLATRVWKLTGALTGSSVVQVPDSTENWWIVHNASTGAQTVQVKTATGTGPTYSTTDKGHKLLYSDGTNVVDVLADLSSITLKTQNQINFEDDTGGEYVAVKAPTGVTSYTIQLPATAPATNGLALTSTTAGVTSWSSAGITTGKAIAMAMIFG
tara:strand:+ start:135 stop:785 length:651 start_codon:yes stop_codon:yes gene_type:complete